MNDAEYVGFAKTANDVSAWFMDTADPEEDVSNFFRFHLEIKELTEFFYQATIEDKRKKSNFCSSSHILW